MNYRFVSGILGRMLLLEAALMLLPLATALIYGEEPLCFVWAALITAAAGALLLLPRQRERDYYAREGFVAVALSWIFISLFGALPFVFSGQIPRYIDALFEIISGFTTTGATILPEVEVLSHGILLWRCFSHWIGGMGVLVFMLAVLPMSDERSMHLMRAEVPGPVKGKLVPRMRHTARILYLIYIALTALQVLFLLCGGMPFFDSLLHAFATAGTGGFSVKTASIGWYGSAYIDGVITVFMILFGVNFNLFYLFLLGGARQALKNEEFWLYLGIIVFSGVTIAANIMGQIGGFVPALRYSFFQVASVISTTGFMTADFDLWPSYSRALLLLLMFIGASSGSTGGGMKVSRLLILFKCAVSEVRKQLFPRTVGRISLNGERIDDRTARAVTAYFALYILIAFLSTLLLSLQGLDLVTTFTAVVSCLSNVGPGLGLVGPTGNYSLWCGAGKLLLCFCMLLGRLEIFPMVMLIAPGVWRHGK